VSGNDIKGKGGLCDMDMDDSDRIYRFTTDVARSVMPKVLNGGNDMFRILVLAGACNPASCKNDTWGSGSAYVTFYAEPGISYYIVVESNQTTSHTFKVECP
jgi:hypothetical protein